MSKTTKKKRTTLSKKKLEVDCPEGSRLQDCATEASEAGSVDKIRDIIFGNQMRDYEGRFDRLEQRLLKEISDLRDEADKRFNSLEQYIKKELESLGTRLKAERDSRAEGEKRLSVEFKDASRLLAGRIEQLDETQSGDSRELRQQLLELNKHLSAEINKKDKESSRVLDQTADELRTDKVDRTALAEVLMEIAVRMSDDLAEKLNLQIEDNKDE